MDLETPESVYLGPWSIGSWMAVRALATNTNASFLDRLYYKKQWTFNICSGLQIAKQLDSREGIVVVIVI